MSEEGRPYVLLRFAKRGPVRFVGHLDLARAFDRAVRRARLPVAYTEGFNPRAKIAFSPPLSIGIESVAELCVIDLARELDAEDVVAALAPELGEGLCILEAEVRRRGRRSPLADLSRAGYEAELGPGGAADAAILRAVEALLSASELQVVRVGKQAETLTDIRPALQALEFVPGDPARLRMVLSLGTGPTARPSEVLAALNEALADEGPAEAGRLTRVALQ